MDDKEPQLNIPASRGQLYLSALNALSLDGQNLNDSAIILEEARRLSEAIEALKTEQETPPAKATKGNETKAIHS